jgi:hypothetical protein
MELVVPIAVNLALGVILLGLFAWRGKQDPLRLTASDALAIFRQHDPEASGTATVAADGRAALIDLGEMRVGLLHRHGRRWNARVISREDLRGVAVAGDEVVLSLADFGWPGARLRLEDGAARKRWLERLARLAGETATSSGTHDGA